ncbi:hypothetical protein M422DRAFT_72043 [Sphaerobolus stellatus SS14]|uniref:Uncharacterized protein n=1 Tax=Sphaerobolus stellatus (strain SS14) TaxID=990650 RepID=A0A0C9UK49_SPHS4|nr:hypothetical protein M422DRAFT_72043 [Sphaerobolus stellatus SS14]
MDKVLGKSRSMLFRKFMGKESQETPPEHQSERASRHIRSVSGPLDHPNPRAVSKSAISAPNEFGLPQIPSASLGFPSRNVRGSPGHPKSRNHANEKQPTRPYQSDTRDPTQSTLGYPSHSPNYAAPATSHPRPVTTPNVKFDESSHPARQIMHGRSHSAITPGENNTSAPARSRRHGMHLHSMGNMVTVMEQKPTLDEKRRDFTSQPASHSSNLGRSLSMSTSNAMNNTSGKTSPRPSGENTRPAPIERTRGYSNVQRPETTSATPLAVRNFSTGPDFVSNLSIPQASSLLHRERKPDTQTTVTTHPPSSFHSGSSANISGPYRQHESQPSFGRNDPPDRLPGSHPSLPSTIFSMSSEYRAQRSNVNNMESMPDAINSRIHAAEEPCITVNARGGRFFGENDAQFESFGLGASYSIGCHSPPLISGAKGGMPRDRLLKELDKVDFKLHPDKEYPMRSNNSPDPKSEDRDEGADTTKPLALRSVHRNTSNLKLVGTRDQFTSSTRQDISSSPQAVGSRATNIRTHSRNPSSISRATTLSGSNNPLLTPPMSSKTSFDTSSPTFISYDKGSTAVTHDGKPCLCQDCNTRISQLEHEVKGLRYILLQLTKTAEPKESELESSRTTMRAQPEITSTPPSHSQQQPPSPSLQNLILANFLTPLSHSSDSESSYSITFPETPSHPHSSSDSEREIEWNRHRVDKVKEKMMATREWSDQVLRARGEDNQGQSQRRAE